MSTTETAWTQPLDADNIDDLTDTLMGTPSGWVGVVSDDQGGIVGYVHESNLVALRDALNSMNLASR